MLTKQAFLASYQAALRKNPLLAQCPDHVDEAVTLLDQAFETPQTVYSVYEQLDICIRFLENLRASCEQDIGIAHLMIDVNHGDSDTAMIAAHKRHALAKRNLVFITTAEGLESSLTNQTCLPNETPNTPQQTEKFLNLLSCPL